MPSLLPLPPQPVEMHLRHHHDDDEDASPPVEEVKEVKKAPVKKPIIKKVKAKE